MKRLDQDHCGLCGVDLPYHGDKAVAFPWLGLRLCLGRCNTIVDGFLRVHDRSQRGRWRSRGAVLGLIKEYGRKEGV